MGAPFSPRRQFDDWSDPALVPSEFLVNYLSPIGTTEWPDLSGGYDGHGAYTRTQHPGTGFKVTSGIITTTSAVPVPHSQTWPASVAAPFLFDYSDTPVDRGLTPPPPPTGALIYDSFSRADQTYAHTNKPDAGCVEYSSDGQVRCWRGYFTGLSPSRPFPSMVQLFAGSMRAGNVSNTLEVVHTGRSDLTVVATRQVSAFSDGMIGVVARMGYHANGSPTWTGYIASHSYIANYESVVQLQRIDGPGKGVVLSTVAVPHGVWRQLKLKCAGSTISVYTDAARVISVTDSTYTGGAGQDDAGVYFLSLPPGEGNMTTNQAALDFAVL
jgi:hypothetical protein